MSLVRDARSGDALREGRNGSGGEILGMMITLERPICSYPKLIAFDTAGRPSPGRLRPSTLPYRERLALRDPAAPAQSPSAVKDQHAAAKRAFLDEAPGRYSDPLVATTREVDNRSDRLRFLRSPA